MSAAPAKAPASTPHLDQVTALQREYGELLRTKRQWEKARIDAARNEDATDARLRVVEAALEGVELGTKGAVEASALLAQKQDKEG